MLKMLMGMINPGIAVMDVIKMLIIGMIHTVTKNLYKQTVHIK